MTWLVAASFAIALAGAGKAAAQEPSYVGSKQCKKCHFKQHKSWEDTKMAQAFELLKPGVGGEAKTAAGLDAQKDYTADPECLPCHVTGWGKPGGFTSIEATPELAGVGCESCHGPGSEYLKEGRMTNDNKEFKRADLVAVGLVIPSSESCTAACHNSDSPFVGDDYVFDFEARKDEGTHEHKPLKYSH